MSQILHFFELLVEYAAEIGATIVELVGIMVLLITAVKSIIGYFQKDPHVRLNLAEGIALALEFKLGGEVLHTVVAHDWNDLAILGATVLLRGAITLLLHWEIKNEKEHAEDRLELAEQMHEAKKKYNLSIHGRHVNITGDKE